MSPTTLPFPVHAVLVLTWASLLAGAALGGQVTYVDADAPGVGDGSSWADAHTSLQDALAAAVAGDEIRVAGGTYRPEGRGPTTDLSFVLPNGVALRGSFGGFGAPAPDAQDLLGLPSRLDADHLGDDVPFEHALNRNDNSSTLLVVAPGAAPTLLQGFVLRGGDGGTSGSGGCVLVDAGTLTLTHCRVEDAEATRHGAGLAARDGASVEVAHSAFLGHRVGGLTVAAVAGGAALSSHGSQLEVRDTSFTGNRAEGVLNPAAAVGGAVLFEPGGQWARFERCRFEDNWSHDFGGALDAGGEVLVSACDFVGNRVGPGSGAFAVAMGGAAFLDGPVTVLRSRFLGNFTAPDGGGTGHAVTLSSGAGARVGQCLFSGNGRLDEMGAALDVSFATGVRIDGCSFTGNLSLGNPFGSTSAGLALGSGATGAVVSNSILWGNVSATASGQAAQVVAAPGTTTFLHNLVQDFSGSLPGSGNVGGDPLFADADGADDLAGTDDDDLSLLAGSPAIDAGSSGAVPADAGDLDCDGDTAEATPLDLEGLVRSVDDPATPDTGLGSPVVDMGAHEHGAGLPTQQWTDLGGGSAGALGQPVFAGSGTFCEGQLLALDLSNAPPGALVLLLESHVSTPVPAFGGVVHAVPIYAQFLLVLGPSGGFYAEIPLGLAVPSGFELFLQVLVQDVTVPGGVIVSNALRAITP